MREDLRDHLIEANKAFDRLLQTKHDVYEERDRSAFVLGWIGQQYDVTDWILSAWQVSS